MIRVSSTATRSDHRSVCSITTALVVQKASDALGNDRQREIHMFHEDARDPVQRMLNAIQPSSYVRPHRHADPPKAETLILLQGSLGFVGFHDDGSVDVESLVLLSSQTGVVGVDCRANVWHTFFAMEPGTVVFEVKAGPFDARTDKDPAPWAPDENTQQGQRYLADLEDRFRRHFRLVGRIWQAE